MNALIYSLIPVRCKRRNFFRRRELFLHTYLCSFGLRSAAISVFLAGDEADRGPFKKPMQAVIPKQIEEFIAQHIDSISELESLLLIRKEPSAQWTADILAKRLYINEIEAFSLLERLQAQGFLTQVKDNPTFFVYSLRSPDVSHTLDTLADLYAKYLIPITQLVHSKPRTKIRQFADAFRIRKD